MLRAIKAKGFLISIDDFGVGYSCLSYLTRLPIDILKVDKTFVEQLSSSKESLALCNAIIHLGKDMGLTVVVEGLETESQVSSVSHSGAHYGQGYFFSKPLDLDSLVSYCLQDREG
jgi:sensor c-di-GMP phosphodiesterase-like protein